MKVKNKPKVAYIENTVAQEDLPLPYVCYPPHYGSFFCFAKNETSQVYLCSCSKMAIENLIKINHIRKKTESFLNDESWLFSKDFPEKFFKDYKSFFSSKAEVKTIDTLPFKSKVCHECKRALPSYEYCVPMYGGQFTRNYGWYIKKQFYEFGVDPSQTIFLDNCPDEICEMIVIKPEEALATQEKLSKDGDWIELNEFNKNLSKQHRQVRKYIENVVRSKLGHKKVGESWTNETNIYYIVKKLYPNLEIKRHYRPVYLNNLELDVFIPELKVGIEYQGMQHYKPLKHWGGAEGLAKVKTRDKLKAKLCLKNDIKLIYITYQESVSEELVRNLIKEQLASSNVGLSY